METFSPSRGFLAACFFFEGMTRIFGHEFPDTNFHELHELHELHEFPDTNFHGITRITRIPDTNFHELHELYGLEGS